jgi:hypothetical protein
LNSIDALKSARERRERLFKRTNPRVRPLDLEKDAWVLWAAYDLGSFSVLKPDPHKPGVFKEPAEFMDYFVRFASDKASVLMVEEDHKFFREKRGPVALVSIDNYGEGWRVEPQFDFFHWATPRQRLASVISFLQMVRYSKQVGVCVVRVWQKDALFCDHVVKAYDLLRPVGRIPNAGPSGAEYLYCAKGRREQQPTQVKEAA